VRPFDGEEKVAMLSPAAVGFLKVCVDQGLTPFEIVEAVRRAGRVSEKVAADLAPLIKTAVPWGQLAKLLPFLKSLPGKAKQFVRPNALPKVPPVGAAPVGTAPAGAAAAGVLGKAVPAVGAAGPAAGAAGAAPAAAPGLLGQSWNVRTPSPNRKLLIKT
jgi:hypothetical protein